MAYPDPSSREDWRSVGIERGQDADALQAGGRLLGSLYLYGYEAECYAKGLIAGGDGRQPPRNHHLMDLILHAGIRRGTLPPLMVAYAESRDITLRYQDDWPTGLDSAALAPAVQLNNFLLKVINRHEYGARRRKRIYQPLKKR